MANDCLQHKTSPQVKIINTEWKQRVVQSEQPIDSLHGVVIASFDEEYDLQVSAIPVKSGYCVVLNGLNATIGYTDFLINIDNSYNIDSCEYKIILEHEQEHISAYLQAFDEELENMKKSIQFASNSIMPIFVPSLDGVSSALDKMQQEFQSHPDVILMKQKLDAQQEILNKKVDQRDDGKRINLCK
ncbi:MAG: hypothetical protein GX944_03235 [Alphaproteobacteria bacterium]|nr:hypothetical protein [Alphaproteobacteria bacterium]